MKTKMLAPMFLALTLVLSACSTSAKKASGPPASPSGKVLNAAIDAFTERTKRLDPYEAPYFNVEESLGTFGDYPSPDYFERAKRNYSSALNDLTAVDFESLTAVEKLTYRIFKGDMESKLTWFDFPNRYLQFNQMGNRLRDYMDSSSEALTTFPFDTVAHYDAFLTRSEGFPAYVERQIALLREGIKNKITLSCTVAPKVPNNYKDALEPVIEKNPFYRPVGFMPASFREADRSRLKESFAVMVRDRILPGFQKFDRFYRDEYLKSCSNGFGVARFPNARAWYAREIKAGTSLSIDPKEVHEIGLREVARISGEFEKIKTQVGYKGPLRTFITEISNDPRFFFTSEKDMFQAFTDVKAQVALRLPEYFSVIPKMDFKLAETSNPEDAAGSYTLPTEMAPYGRFVVNTKNLKSVPTFGITTLMLHETNPGHHLQLALQFEMKDTLSEYQRKIFDSNSFVEGWALYSEYLGNEMELFKDPMQRFGHLNDEMLRAVRLVVDTGIHSLGWSQKKAIAYAKRYLASDDVGIEVEINRYSVWPGQALGYKIGQLKILQLRRKAEQELGDKFDIKAFHAVVIGTGTIPLGILEDNVTAWIAAVKGTL